jgi:hypothetical protein
MLGKISPSTKRSGYPIAVSTSRLSCKRAGENANILENGQSDF